MSLLDERKSRERQTGKRAKRASKHVQTERNANAERNGSEQDQWLSETGTGEEEEGFLGSITSPTPRE
jgi:phosphodiesterase/alkaline phosphatase D-like protein